VEKRIDQTWKKRLTAAADPFEVSLQKENTQCDSCRCACAAHKLPHIRWLSSGNLKLRRFLAVLQIEQLVEDWVEDQVKQIDDNKCDPPLLYPPHRNLAVHGHMRLTLDS